MLANVPKVFEMHAENALEAGTCTIHSKIFHNRNLRWGAIKCRDSSRASPWFALLGARFKESLQFFSVSAREEIIDSGRESHADSGQGTGYGVVSDRRISSDCCPDFAASILCLDDDA